MHLRYLTKNRKSCLKKARFWLRVNSSWRRLIQVDSDYKFDWEACTDISFYFVKPDPRTYFPLQYQPPSSRVILYYCSGRSGNSNQGSDELDLYWSWDNNQDKAVQNTGATEPKTQSSRNSDGICRWLYPWSLTLRNRTDLPCKCRRSKYSIYRNTLNVILLRCQSLDSTEQNMISI